MSLMLALLLAQVGPSVSPGAGGALPQAPLEIPRKAKPGEPAPAPSAAAENADMQRMRSNYLAALSALNAGDADGAVRLFDAADAAARAGGDPEMANDIAVERSRALVALNRLDEAGAALAQARAAYPGNYVAWLLSATLSRRQGKLVDAQAQIERAALLRPVEPAIGLEAGVIAVLAGRDDAARRSWQSVIAAEPDSEAAKRAQGYLDQLGPESPSKPQ